MRIARDFGTVSELFPPGISTLMELPHRWWEAIRMAMVFLSFDDLAKDERPPRTIWLDEEKLNAWFQRVEADRERRNGGSGKGDGPGPIEDPVENPAAKRLISG